MKKRKDKKGRILLEGESQRDDGRYMYRYTDLNGERQVYYSYKLVATDATPKGRKDTLSIREFKLEIDITSKDGLMYKKGEMTLNQLYDNHHEYKYTMKKITPGTYRNYNNAWKYARNHKVSHLKIKDLRKHHFELIYKDLLDNGAGKATVRLIHKLHKGSMKYAYEADYIRKNYAIGALDDFDVHLNSKEALTIEQQVEFLNFVATTDEFKYLYCVLEFMLQTAIRVSEMTGLTAHEIDMEDGIIIINKQYIRQIINKTSCKSKMKIKPPKSYKSNREIPLNAKAKEVLEMQIEYLERVGLTDNFVVDSYKKGEVCEKFIFLTKEHKLWESTHFNIQLYKVVDSYNGQETLLAKKEGREPNHLPKISAHVLRHTACTRMSERGMCPRVLQDIMGHDKPQTTKVYNHVNRKRLTDEMLRVDEFISF